MNRPRMTGSATALLRSLLQRAGLEQNRIFLTDWTSTEWQSLTFTGERHVAGFMVRGSDPRKLALRWIEGLEEAELAIGPAAFVGDIRARVSGQPRDDGAILVEVEALTLQS